MAEKPKPEQDGKGRFVAGNSGNGGRPKGSRNKLGEQFLTDLQADWEAHGVEAIQQVRSEKPDAYLKVVASILPKELNVNVNAYDDMSDDELIERIRRLDDTIRPFLDSAGAGGTDSGDAAPTAH
jgi:hypothetical protein